MRLCIRRGAHQIGGSCVEVESKGQRLVLDLGLPLDAEESTVDLMPPVPGLREPDDSLLGVLLSHPHLDHYGLLAHVRPDLQVAMGAAGRRILEAAAPWVPNAVVPPRGPDLQNQVAFSWGPFTITPFLVDHSAFDAYAFMVEADGRRVFYSGDFRAHGRKGKLFDRMVAAPPRDLDVLLMEGSSLGRLPMDATFETEAELEGRMAAAFQETEGLALVHASAQNIDRMVTVFRAAKASGRRLVVDLYTAAVLEATGTASIPQSAWPKVALFIPQAQRIQILENERFDLLKRHSPNRIYMTDLAGDPKASVMLFRGLHRPDLERGKALAGARFFYSMWEGYLEQPSGARLTQWTERLGIPFLAMHTSGHAGPADLQRFATALDPKELTPIHSFNPDRYAEFFPRVKTHPDGEWWAV